MLATESRRLQNFGKRHIEVSLSSGTMDGQKKIIGWIKTVAILRGSRYHRLSAQTVSPPVLSKQLLSVTNVLVKPFVSTDAAIALNEDA